MKIVEGKVENWKEEIRKSQRQNIKKAKRNDIYAFNELERASHQFLLNNQNHKVHLSQIAQLLKTIEISEIKSGQIIHNISEIISRCFTDEKINFYDEKLCVEILCYLTCNQIISKQFNFDIIFLIVDSLRKWVLLDDFLIMILIALGNLLTYQFSRQITLQSLCLGNVQHIIYLLIQERLSPEENQELQLEEVDEILFRFIYKYAKYSSQFEADKIITHHKLQSSIFKYIQKLLQDIVPVFDLKSDKALFFYLQSAKIIVFLEIQLSSISIKQIFLPIMNLTWKYSETAALFMYISTFKTINISQKTVTDILHVIASSTDKTEERDRKLLCGMINSLQNIKDASLKKSIWINTYSDELQQIFEEKKELKEEIETIYKITEFDKYFDYF